MRIEDLPGLFSRIAADLAPKGLRPAVGVYDLEGGDFVVGYVALDEEDREALAGFGDEGRVLLVPGQQVPLTDLVGDDGQIDAAEIVSIVQDWAMDELGDGWPEVTDADGAFVALLVPVEDEEDGLVWTAHGQASVPVGQLAARP